MNIKAVSLNYLDVILANGSFYKDLTFPYTPASDGCGVEVNDIHPVFDSVFPLDQLQDAYRRLEEGKNIGKIVIKL